MNEFALRVVALLVTGPPTGISLSPALPLVEAIGLLYVIWLLRTGHLQVTADGPLRSVSTPDPLTATAASQLPAAA